MNTEDEIFLFPIDQGVIFPDGPLWREQRRFMMRTLKEFGVGKRTMEEHILNEIHFCTENLRDILREVCVLDARSLYVYMIDILIIWMAHVK